MDENTSQISDYFAELYVAGMFAEAGWNIYFPHRDFGFDFIISKSIGERTVIRPVQVKGKYPSIDKKDKPTYGYIGRLSQLHPEMVLAIPYFPRALPRSAPDFVAYMPCSCIKSHKRGHRCEPAAFSKGKPMIRRDHARFFDNKGMAALESEDWQATVTGV